MATDSHRPYNVSLLRLLLSFGLLNISEWGFVTALSIHAFRVGGTLYVGLIGLRLLVGALSSAVIAPLIAGRRGVLSLIALVRTVLLGAAAALTLAGASFLAILIFVLADSVVAAGYRPAQSRVLPSLAYSPQQLTRAVAGTSIAKTLGQAAGALLGGGAVEFMSPGAAMAWAAGVMLLAFAGGVGLRSGTAVEVRSGAQPLRDGLAAFPAVLRDPEAWPLVLASVLRTLVRGLWGALLVVVALHLLHTGSSSVGLIQAATAVGAIIALPLTATQIGRLRLALPCAASFIAAGLAVGLISAASALWVVAALVCVWGASMAMADATSLSLLHRLLNTGAFSRTVAVMESLKLISEGVGALMAPALVAIFGLRAAIAIAGVPLPLLMVVGWGRVRNADELAAGRGRLVSLLHRVPLLRGLDMASLEQLAAYAQPLHVSAGSDVIREGEAGDRFYVIESGQADVLIHGLEVNRIGAGADFGERALLRDTPRTATVRARSDLQLQAIERDSFLEAVTGERGIRMVAAEVSGLPLTEVLATAPMFARLPAGARQQLAGLARSERIEAGTVIFEQGDPAADVFALLSGRVELIEDGQLRAVLEPGDTFGELSAIHATGRLAQARAVTPVVVAVLPAASVRQELAALNGQPEVEPAGAAHDSTPPGLAGELG